MPLPYCSIFNTDIKFNDRDSSLPSLPGARLARSVREIPNCQSCWTLSKIDVRIAYVFSCCCVCCKSCCDTFHYHFLLTAVYPPRRCCYSKTFDTHHISFSVCVCVCLCERQRERLVCLEQKLDERKRVHLIQFCIHKLWSTRTHVRKEDTRNKNTKLSAAV